MNRLLILPVLLLTLLVGNPAYSADFHKGYAARIDYDLWMDMTKVKSLDAGTTSINAMCSQTQ